MPLIATTPHPDEVRKQFHEYADVLDIYASDQMAMIRRTYTKAAMRQCEIRSKIYSEIAAEIRTIKFTEEA